MRKAYRIPLRELKTRNIKVSIAKPHQRVQHLLSTHVIDTRKLHSNTMFFSSVEEAKRAELRSWERLAKTFEKRTRKL